MKKVLTIIFIQVLFTQIAYSGITSAIAKSLLKPTIKELPESTIKQAVKEPSENIAIGQVQASKIIGKTSANNTHKNIEIIYKCYFTNFSDQKGNHKEILKFTFIVNEANNKAYVVGNFGKEKVIHIDRGNGKTFVEITGLGNVMTTTMDKKMQAVHGRNSVGVMGELIPSQFYGSCIEK